MYTRMMTYTLNKSCFIFGPRGTGKSTWIKKNFPDAYAIDLLESEKFIELSANPQRLEQSIPEGKTTIVIDEIQRVPDILNEVHRLIEKNHYRFILTGSSARKLRRKNVNLLAGRALTYSFYPLTALELGKDFNLQHSLRYGHLPCAYTEPDPKKYLESYIQTYLREEVQQEGLVRNLGSFVRFLEIASFSQGSILNMSSIARECSIERKVVENYFGIIEDLLIAYKVPVFTKKAKRRMIAHQKFYFFDSGVYQALRPRGPLDTTEEIEGASAETLLFQELRAVNEYCNLGYQIFYWHTAENEEVDFILYGENGIKAFEIKRTSRVNDEMFRGLELFLKDYPMSKAFLIYGGDKGFSRGPITVIPFKEALLSLPELLKAG